MATNIVVLLQNEDGRRLVREKCKAAGLDMVVLEQLIDTELNHSGKLKKRGINEDFDGVFGALDEEEE